MKLFLNIFLLCIFYSTHVYSELLSREVLIKNSDQSEYVFNVEIADTPTSHSKGLMGRKSLLKRSGMLFVWDKEEYRHFWMKNTPLSLDIIFFDSEGLFINSATNTKPYSLGNLSSNKPSQYVLELVSGSVLNYKITYGTKLIAPFITLQ